jgi:hypothetical protein
MWNDDFWKINKWLLLEINMWDRLSIYKGFSKVNQWLCLCVYDYDSWVMRLYV